MADLEFLKQFVGIAGITLIKSIVDSFGFSSGVVKVILSLVLGVAINLALALVFVTDIRVAIVIGLFVGLLSNGYADLKNTGKL